MGYSLGLRAILNAELERKFGSKRPTLKNLARSIDMPITTLQMFLEGRRRPKQNNIERLAQFFYPEATPQRQEFVQKVLACRDKTPPQRGLLDELAAGARPFRVRSLDYPPLSGRNSFVGDFFLERFLSLSGIKIEHHSGPSSDSADVEAIQDDLQSGHTDLVLGHLSTADRALRLHFVAHTPIRVSLGAICHKRHALHLAELQNILLHGKEHNSTLTIQPILLSREIGWLHCVRRLGYEETEIVTVRHLDANEFASALRKSSYESGSAIPVIVVDELTSVRILGRMNGEAIPIVPLSTERSSRHCECRREMPIYSVGAPISRVDSDLVDFFAESLPVFMQNDIEGIARDYFDLYGKLINILAENTVSIPLEYLDSLSDEERQYFAGTLPNMPRTNEDKHLVEQALRSSLHRRWARTMLRLQSADITSYQSQLPWLPILKRAREKLDEQIGKNEVAEIQEFLKATSKRYAWHRLHRIFADLEESYDVKLDRQLYYPSGCGAPVPGLTYKIASTLLRHPAHVEPNIQEADQTQVKEVEMILHEAASLYTTQDERRNALQKMNALMKQFRKRHQNYLLAIVEGEPAGLVHFGPVSGSDGLECEIHQLFVRPVWRSYGFARKLVSGTIESANKAGFQTVRVNTLEAPHATMMLYRSMGFRENEGDDYLRLPIIRHRVAAGPS